MTECTILGGKFTSAGGAGRQGHIPDVTKAEAMSPFFHGRAMDGFQAKRIIDNWIGVYSSERPCTALDKRRPDTAYFSKTGTRKAA